MKRAAPVEMRKALEVVDALKKAGILFVAIPILDTEDKDKLIAELYIRLEKIEGMHTVSTK